MTARRALLIRSAAALVLLVAMVILSRDFGATWDERALQAYGSQIYDYYRGIAPRASIDTSFGYTRIYPAFAEVLSAAVQHVIAGDPYMIRHAVNSVFGWVGVLFGFALARRLFGERAGWLAAALLLCMPRYVADSMNNTKDLPFAVLMLAGLYYVVTIDPQYPFVSWKHGLKFAAAAALALNVRVMAVVLVGYLGVAVAVAIVASRETSPRRLAATVARLAVIALIVLVGGTLFWPWAQEQPIVRPLQAFFLASSFSWGNPSLFAGRDIAAADLPWYYLPTWLAISIPLVVLAGVCLSLPRLWRRDGSRVRFAGVYLFVLIPATMVMVQHLTLYDGIRHVLFIVPPLAVIAAAGWDLALTAQPKALRLAVMALLTLGIAEPVLFAIRNHPNETVYFSPIIGGPRGAFARFEMDYWGNCVLSAESWADRQARLAGMPVVVTANAWEIAVADMTRYRTLGFRQRRHGGYHLDIRLMKGRRQDLLDTIALPDILYRVSTADGAPLCIVLPGPEYPSLAARLAHASVNATGAR